MESITLSTQLLARLRTTLEAHDERARDPSVTLQYLAATLGLLVAQYPAAFEDKQELLEELFAFAKQVFAERSLGGSPSEPTQPAFGIWRPGDP